MAKEFSWLIPDHIRYHRFWDDLNFKELSAGVKLFIDINREYAPRPVHIIVDLRDVTRHSLSMVEIYRLTRSLTRIKTGHIIIFAEPVNHSMQTFYSLVEKIVASAFNIPYRHLYSLDDCHDYCRAINVFSEETIQKIITCYQTNRGNEASDAGH